MKIQMKLHALALGALLACGGAAAVAWALLTPLERIAAERGLLDDLSGTAREVRVEANRLDSQLVGTGSGEYEASVARLNAAFDGLAGIVALPAAQPEVASALTVIGDLRPLIKDNAAAVSTAGAPLADDARAVFSTANGISVQRLMMGPALPGREAALDEARAHVRGLASAIGILDSDLAAAAQVIAEQSGVIDAAIVSIKERAFALTAAAVALIIALTVVASGAVAQRIGRSVRTLQDDVEILSDGRLDVDFAVRGNDEIAGLAARLSGFAQGLDGSLRGIRGAIADNSRVRDELSTESLKLAGTVDAAGADMEALARLDSELGARVAEARRGVAGITGGIEALDHRIIGQIAMVEESTASVTQMLASIGQIARVAERDRALALELVRDADAAREVFESAFERIEAIAGQVELIKDMLNLIESIAAQTNLLAMNAAIESAHAGDAGRGFAVVADEIGKLAEASGRNSQEISSSIKLIITAIGEARNGSRRTTEVFGGIEHKIHDVSASIQSIDRSITESNEGGRQIIQAMTALQELSAGVSSDSAAMADAARRIGESMDALDRVAASQREAIAVVGGGISASGSASHAAGALAERLAAIGTELENRIAGFSLRGDAPAEDAKVPPVPAGTHRA